jgi:antirestriction protein
MEEQPQQGEGSMDGEPERGERQLVPRIWVASLSDYNAGVLYGTWIDAAQDIETVEAAVSDMLTNAPTPGAEEYAIFDFDDFGQVSLDEYDRLVDVTNLAQGIAEHGPAFAHFASLVEWRDAEQLSHFEDAYQGHFTSMAEYGEHVLEAYDFQAAIDNLPELLIPYIHIDADGFARDMEMGGMISTSEGEGGIYVFESDW